MTVEIVLLAMVALFVGLRLYSVLGRRTGHEQQPVTRPETVGPVETAPPIADAAPERAEASGLGYEERAARGIRAIVTADPAFDVARFLDGAQAAYRMILEAFWKADREELRYLVGGSLTDAVETHDLWTFRRTLGSNDPNWILVETDAA